MQKNIFPLFIVFFLSILGGFFYVTYAGNTANPSKSFTNKDVILNFTCSSCKINGEYYPKQVRDDSLLEQTEGNTVQLTQNLGYCTEIVLHNIKTYTTPCYKYIQYTVPFSPVTKNGIYTIDYKDIYDRTIDPQTNKAYQEVFNIDYIDKTLPQIKSVGGIMRDPSPNIGCTNKGVNVTIKYLDSLNRLNPNDRISGFDDNIINCWSSLIIPSSHPWNDTPSCGYQSHTFTENGSWTFFIKDKAGNQIEKGIDIGYIDTNPPTIQDFSIDKNGDSSLRMGGTYPIVFSVNDTRPAGCTDQSIFYDIYIQKDGETLNDQSRQGQGTTIGSTVRNNKITFVGNGKYGIFLRIRDTAGNEVSQSLGNINSANIPASSSNTPSTTTTSSISTPVMDDILGVKIIGTYQGQGKDQQILAGQEANMTLVQSSSIRDSIRKNAYILIRNRTANDGKIIGGIRYATGDYVYDDSEIYDTLIMRNGNLTINTNVTKNRGFIILDDDMNGVKGNILVGTDVTEIKGILFGEGKLDGERTSMKQLRILGSLLTRNTIGGSIFKDGGYILPGNKTINDEAMAKSYDLNLLRGKNDGWDFNGDGVENGNEFKNATLLIRYNPENSTNPPPGFGQ